MTERDEERNFKCSSGSDFLRCFEETFGEQWSRCRGEADFADLNRSGMDAFDEYQVNCQKYLDDPQDAASCKPFDLLQSCERFSNQPSFQMS